MFSRTASMKMCWWRGCKTIFCVVYNCRWYTNSVLWAVTRGRRCVGSVPWCQRYWRTSSGNVRIWCRYSVYVLDQVLIDGSTDCSSSLCAPSFARTQLYFTSSSISLPSSAGNCCTTGIKMSVQYQYWLWQPIKISRTSTQYYPALANVGQYPVGTIPMPF